MEMEMKKEEHGRVVRWIVCGKKLGYSVDGKRNYVYEYMEKGKE